MVAKEKRFSRYMPFGSPGSFERQSAISSLSNDDFVGEANKLHRVLVFWSLLDVTMHSPITLSYSRISCTIGSLTGAFGFEIAL